MLLFAAVTAPVKPVLALAEACATAALYVYFNKSNQKRRQGILQYIDSVTGSVDTASKSTLINSPLPIMVFRPDTGEVIWSARSPLLPLLPSRSATLTALRSARARFTLLVNPALLSP